MVKRPTMTAKVTEEKKETSPPPKAPAPKNYVQPTDKIKVMKLNKIPNFSKNFEILVFITVSFRLSNHINLHFFIVVPPESLG